MQKTSSWSRQHQLDQSIGNEQNQQEQPSKNKQTHPTIYDIVSERISEQIVDDLTTLRNKKNQTPLIFYCKIGSSYVFSFPKKQGTSMINQVINFLTKFICTALVMIAIQIFVCQVAKVPYQFKAFLICTTVVQILSFLLLFFLDPGTLFDDEQQTMDQQRLYCQICRVYRSQKSHHCAYCGKCVKGYDHHCGFFGKCIGRRNILIFGLFLTSSGLFGIGVMVSLLYTLFNGVLIRTNRQIAKI